MLKAERCGEGKNDGEQLNKTELTILLVLHSNDGGPKKSNPINSITPDKEPMFSLPFFAY